jgi:HEAT repeat protein
MQQSFMSGMSISKPMSASERTQPISIEVIKALSQQLVREPSIKVKETIAGVIGTIGKPDALHSTCIDCLIKAYEKCLTTEESALKCMIVWSLGRLASHETGLKIKKLLITALQDSYWKVRAAACTAIANFKEQMADKGLPILMKLLSDGQQNK